MEDSKKENIKYQVNVYLDNVLKLAESQGKLDYFSIEINNHNGNLKMNCNLKEIKKVY